MPRPLLPLWAALIVAAGSGIVLDAAFPDRGWWPLAFVGVAGYLVALRGRSVGGAVVVGFVGGVYFYLVHISWAEQFLGDVVPMLALCLAETLFFSAGAALVTLAYRWVPRALPAWLTPVVVAGLWTAREAVASVFPYGGFAWGRVALSQTEGPFTHLFAWLGVSGTGFALVLLTAVAVEAALSRQARALTRVALPVGLATVLLTVPAFPVSVDGSLRVAAVQGNGKAAYLDEREYGDLLRAQLAATRLVDPADDVDVLLWPEGSTDVDPLRSESAARIFDTLATRYDAPVVFGAITTDGAPEGEETIWNSSLLWLPGSGLADTYNKRHPVPFGEYIPDRAFWRPFAPDLIDLVQREYTPGTTDPVFDLGEVTVAVNICFDVVDDGLMRESVRDGAQVLFAQSNNADFGHTDEGLQQLAIARARALELGRSVVNVSTVGTSAILLPDGSTLDRLPWYTPGVLVDDVPTSSTVTPAAAAGLQLEWLAGLFGLLALGVAAFGARRGRRG